jgi:hypothetical protein
MKFNQNVTVSDDPTKFINVKMNINRLLQDTSSMVNNGVAFTA